MIPGEIRVASAKFRDDLLNDTLPFWLDRSIDREYGGYFTAFDRDGRRLETDKAVWFQGRFAWMLATIAETVEPRNYWLERAKHGIDFLQRYCVDRDGRYFFLVTRDGQPLRKRRYVFSECFAAMAYAAYGKSAGSEDHCQMAIELFRDLRSHLGPNSFLEPKVNPGVRPMKSLASPMILIGVAQEIRKATGLVECTEVIEQCIDEIRTDFVKGDLACVLENVGKQGEVIETFDGRLINPGHSIELAWFLMEEARQRDLPELTALGIQILDWSLKLGWDKQYGGLYYFRDCHGFPCAEYWHDMKFWWPHAEAIIATLLAWRLTGEERYWSWHHKIYSWSYQHFADPEFGEWFGYLHRDGTLSSTIKGNQWKGPFHLPRMQFYCWQLLEEVIHAQPV
ncbi:AGE family epimerase/isomerase [Bremerella sp. P1]|uniref:AGE family epimerase/isomerase n=1 Tax=Bremerella sp. P1 TaxID=3026424 RepID=UPI002367971F|nr:AGE family epimerase/isomerase [Bremerella sp. P1]WDI41492.1 AGE family epimerase/isomerase [Bremerella sp. P1]